VDGDGVNGHVVEASGEVCEVARRDGDFDELAVVDWRTRWREGVEYAVLGLGCGWW
jgi:hypothetical protein